MITAREIILKAYRHEKPYWVPSQTTDQDTCIPSCLEEGPTGLGITEDGWGVHWVLDPSQPGPFPDESFQVLTFDELEDWKEMVVFPDPEKYDWEAAAAKDTAGWDRENKISSVIIVNGMLERMNALMGIEDSITAIMADPEDAFDLLSAIADQRIGYLKKIAKYYKPDKIQFHDDYGAVDRLLFPPDAWREVIKPNLKKVVDACHDLGMIYEHHSCGFIRPLIPDFIELGIDAWNPVQFTNDPKALLEEYAGKLTFVGGFDNLHILDRIGATYDEKYAHMLEMMETLEPYGSWVAQPSLIDMASTEALIDSLYKVNAPLMEAVGIEAKRPENYRTESVYDTAENIGDK